MTATMNISLPQSLKDYVGERVKEGRFSTPSDYVRTLIREDHKRQAQEKLERLLLEGLDSGNPLPLDEQEFQNIRVEALTRAAGRLKRPK